MDNRYILRRADITDIDALSQLYENFSNQYSEKDLDMYFCKFNNPENFTKKINNPKRAIWVIEDKKTDELIAFAMAGPCDINDIPHHDVCLNKHGVINLLYVRRDQRSRGFGQQLMNVILPWLEEYYPNQPIWLAMYSKNLKAQKFYTHYGFNKVDDIDHSIGELEDRDFIMKRQLSS